MVFFEIAKYYKIFPKSVVKGKADTFSHRSSRSGTVGTLIHTINSHTYCNVLLHLLSLLFLFFHHHTFCLFVVVGDILN